MRTGRPKKTLTVNPLDREKLELLARRPKTAQRVAIRSKIVLRAAEGLSNQEIARRLGVTGATAGKWRERYRVHGMEGLSDEPRPGTPRKITGRKSGRGSYPNPGKFADSSYALEHEVTRGESWVEPKRSGTNLA